uniref:uncharacterized protein LOC122600413 n=1 Tax=Erigeron canadensis TaxID=72917 RepID=UPI001CB95C8C|nr:uncharacterized protein LOC122600413 [Erigeron canadensis]
MSSRKKMVAFDPSSYEDHHMARSYKHQILLQDYMDLHQETEAARNNLTALKKKQLILEAEVRFLRQRHKLLLKNKSSTSQEQFFIKPQLTQSRISTKKKLHLKKQSTSQSYAEKKKAPRSMLSADFDSILKKQQPVQRVVANQRVRVIGPKASSCHDLNQIDDISGSQELMGQNQKPVIDLNQIYREDVKSQSRCQPFDSLTKGLIRNGFREHHTDVQFSVGRNLGGGSVLRSGPSGGSKKRKISWQDPVAVIVGS